MPELVVSLDIITYFSVLVKLFIGVIFWFFYSSPAWILTLGLFSLLSFSFRK